MRDDGGRCGRSVHSALILCFIFGMRGREREGGIFGRVYESIVDKRMAFGKVVGFGAANFHGKLGSSEIWSNS